MLIPIGFLAASGGVEAAFEHIATTVLGANAASVTFDVSAYASSYKHLQIRGYARSSESGVPNPLSLRFNSNSGANYSSHYIRGNLTDNTVRVGNYMGATSMEIGYTVTSSYPAAMFSPFVIDVQDAFSNSKNKTVRGTSGSDYNYGPEARFGFHSGAYYSATPVSTVTLLSNGGAFNFITNSRFSIYGVRG